jgi:curli biogenesis system outer membrane secretion channel CsgG
MKRIIFAVAAVACSACVSAFAQTSTGAQPADGTAQVASNSAMAAGGQWVAPDDQPTEQKTRAQVYQELVQAEHDGQLAYLDSTIYAHP